jgi:hypothetical protein
LSLGLLLTEGDAKRRLRLLVPPLACACAINAVLLSFFLYLMFAHGFQHGIIVSPWLVSADLLGFIVPTPLNALGQIHLLAAITTNFRTSLFEPSSYIPLALFLILALYARSHWRTPAGRVLVDLLIILCLLTMGPWLEIAGRITIGLPWLVLGDLPLLNKALPAGLSVYVFLVLAIIIVNDDGADAMAGEKSLQLLIEIGNARDVVQAHRDRPLRIFIGHQQHVTDITTGLFKIHIGAGLPQHAVALPSERQDEHGLAGRQVMAICGAREKRRQVYRTNPVAGGQVW